METHTLQLQQLIDHLTAKRQTKRGLPYHTLQISTHFFDLCPQLHVLLPPKQLMGVVPSKTERLSISTGQHTRWFETKCRQLTHSLSSTKWLVVVQNSWEMNQKISCVMKHIAQLVSHYYVPLPQKKTTSVLVAWFGLWEDSCMTPHIRCWSCWIIRCSLEPPILISHC